MTGTLTEEEKARVRHHMGYPEVQPAASLVYGVPKPAQTAFLLESAMGLLIDTAVPRVRSILQICDDLEQQMVDAQCYLVADSLGEIHLAGAGGDSKNRLVTERLEGEYVRWAMRLADVFGCPLYPFSERFRRGTGTPRYGNLGVRNG